MTCWRRESIARLLFVETVRSIVSTTVALFFNGPCRPVDG